MTKFKGTTGTWFIDETQNLRPTHIVIKTKQNSRIICLISEPKNMDIEDEANAKLIAVAPELLQILIETLSYLGDEKTWLEGEQHLGFKIKKIIEKTI